MAAIKSHKEEIMENNSISKVLFTASTVSLGYAVVGEEQNWITHNTANKIKKYSFVGLFVALTPKIYKNADSLITVFEEGITKILFS